MKVAEFREKIYEMVLSLANNVEMQPSDVGVAEVPSTIVGLDDLRVAVPSENFAEVPHTGLADQEIKLSGKWIQKLQS